MLTLEFNVFTSKSLRKNFSEFNSIYQNSELNYWLTFKNLNGSDHSTQEVELGFELVWQEVEFTDSSLLILRKSFKP